MKQLAVFGVLAACLVLANAAAVDPLDASIKTLESYTQLISEKAEEVIEAIDHKYDEVFAQPQERVETAVHLIEDRKEENEACVSQYEQKLELVVEDLESSLETCIQTAYSSSTSVSIKIVTKTTEIGSDSYTLAKGVQRCRRHSNSVLKRACFAKQLIRARKLISKTKQAVNDLQQVFDKTVPQILVDLKNCAEASEHSAMVELENINRNIDSCITVKEIKTLVLNRS